jgi:hypothetical protein
MTMERWLLLLAYLLVAFTLARAASASRTGARLGRAWPGAERRDGCRREQDRRRTVAWALLSGFVCLAGVGRATGWVHALSEVGRRIARELLWYEHRGPWQMAATGAAAAACLGLGVLVGRSRRAHRRQRLAVVAAMLLTAILATRAISWHAAGAWMAHRVHGVKLGTLVEVAGLMALGVAAVVAAASHRRIREDLARTAGGQPSSPAGATSGSRATV